ncbi:MAG TPA: TonB-dependent receptor [Parvularculaceae bacterium]|nr:TonB-dependent receptor [Parvularculaceae bacterium]
MMWFADVAIDLKKVAVVARDWRSDRIGVLPCGGKRSWPGLIDTVTVPPYKTDDELTFNMRGKASSLRGNTQKPTMERGFRMPIKYTNHLRCTVAAAALAIVATGAAGQEGDENTAGLDRIIVTAQKKEEDLQRAPVAVGVLGGDYLDASGVADLNGITQRIAGFAYQQENRTQTAVAIRGAGSLDDSPGADSAVGFFIDGVYMGNPATFDFDLLDLERVEVLRGPQGTTFGRNVVGGAINFITRRPTDELTGRASVTYGRFGQFDINGSISGPLVEGKLYGLVSFSSNTSDGYTKNLTTGAMLDQVDQQAGRVKLLWTPNDSIENTLTGDYLRDTSVGFSRILTGPTVPLAVAGGVLSPNDRTSVQDFDGGYDTTTWGVNNTFKYALGDGGEVVSVSAYRNNDINTAFEIDGAAAPILTFTDQAVDVEEFTQELRVVNSWGKLDYIAGLYYYNQKISRIETIDENILPGSAISDLFGFDGSLTEELGQSIKTNSYAAFAQATYNISDTLRVTVGGRYTWEKKSGNTLCIVPGLQCGGGATPYDVAVEESWGAFTPKFTLDADITDDIFAYATVSRGFKSGGFASGFDDPESAAVPFNPEFAWNYEIGLKSMWFDNRLQMNLTGFYVEYNDLQVRQFGSGVTAGKVIVGNAGSAHNLGLEVEAVAAPAEGLNIFANYTYQDSEYDKLELEGVDFSGNVLMLTPKHSISAGVDYTVELPGGSSVNMLADVSRKSLYYGGPDNLVEEGTKFNGIVNASLAYNFPGDNWSVQVSGKNLRNERASVSSSDFAFWGLSLADAFAGNSLFSRNYTAPRTWAVTVKCRF